MSKAEIVYFSFVSFCIFGFIRNMKFLHVTKDKQQYNKNIKIVIIFWCFLFLIGTEGHKYMVNFNPTAIEIKKLIYFVIAPPVLIAIILPVYTAFPGYIELQRAKSLWQSLPLKYKDGVLYDNTTFRNHINVLNAKDLIMKSISKSYYSHDNILHVKANEGIAWQELGLLHRVINETNEALECFKKSIAIINSGGGITSENKFILKAYRETCFRLGELNHAMNIFDEAKEWYNLALEADKKLGHDDKEGETLTVNLLQDVLTMLR